MKQEFINKCKTGIHNKTQFRTITPTIFLTRDTNLKKMEYQKSHIELANKLIDDAKHLEAFIGHMDNDLAKEIAKHVCEEIIYSNLSESVKTLYSGAKQVLIDN